MGKKIDAVSGEKAAKPAHSLIGASSMHRWAACPGSVNLSKDIPRVDSEFAAEGTRAHEVAEKVLRGQGWPHDVTPEMREHVQVYTDFVVGLRARCVPLLIEHRFDISDYFKIPGIYGTADCVGYDPETKHLIVVDLKYGAGVFVDAYDNEQLKYYALGALVSLKLPVRSVELVVVQPRIESDGGPIRRHTLSPLDLVDFAADLERAARATFEPDAPLVAGEHCRFCPAAGVCPELSKTALEIAAQDFEPVKSTGPLSPRFTPEQLGEYLDAIPKVEAWVESVRALAYATAMSGGYVPGYKLVQKVGRRHWCDPEQATKHLADVPEAFEPAKLKTPAQVEKVLGKRRARELEGLIATVSSGLTLVHDSDRRKPMQPSDAASDFEVLEPGNPAT